MPTHPDAIGYIRDLGHSEGVPWLEMICDLAASGATNLNAADLEILVQLFTKRASYIRQPAPPAAAPATRAAAAASDRLEKIGPFTGFKRLGDSLAASFPKPVTIIFGTNGSGKSSFCEALQILASNDAPRRPLNDVLSAATTSPSFTYKFSSDAAAQLWTPRSAYGAKSSVIKYFDTGIAILNVQNTVQPGRIIALSPFKLDVFETALRHLKDLRAELVLKQSENAVQLSGLVERIRAEFAEFKGSVLAEMMLPTVTALEAALKLGESYSKGSGLDGKLQRKAELEKATSEDGLKLLKGEASALKAIHGEVQPILDACERLIEIDPVSKSKALKAKEAELELLAKALIPSGATLDKLMALLRPANEICNLHSSQAASCPLCKQGLRESELELFRQYAALLTGELDTAITELRKLIKSAERNLNVIADSSPDSWAKDSVLAVETVAAIKDAGTAIQTCFKAGKEIDQECVDAALMLRALFDDLASQLEVKEKLIKEAGESRAELLKQLGELSSECKALLYAKRIAESSDLIRDALRRTLGAADWHRDLPEFTSAQRKLTSAAKRAHKDLVVGDFKARLNSEYLALAEKGMSAFGVDLKDVGGDGAVTVDHHVAGERIDSVLSEGEQRIHALALFFAELETCEQQVIVFDDPISSFDFNYIGNYCNRLRDLIQAHPNRQIIVLTHNWEFFMQIQKVLKDARLEHQMSVCVLENCVSLAEYSEKIADLKTEIDSRLSGVGEPTKAEKEVLAGKMRRLLEAVVNTHVFNNQRHQFKQKSQAVSAFHDFTKVVPLLPAEAQALKDLYAKLSTTEHDDPTNSYVNTDKAMFLSRYNAIKAIEAAIVSRK
ncbi:MAG: AAA family ATPase [Burkholderiales bacterium]|nr:AAA family ATPase [Burkholderiales bacterium]